MPVQYFLFEIQKVPRLFHKIPVDYPLQGKCTVALFNEVEQFTSYADRDDAFYYRLIYDPIHKRLQEDRGSMRIGSDYQSEIQPMLAKGEFL